MAGGAAGSGSIEREIRSLFRAGSAAGLSDRQLLARFSEDRGDVGEAAFAALVDRHGGMVLRTCRAILPGPHDADDAAQAVFLVLARRAGSIRRADSLGSWLYGISLRVARKMRNDADRRRTRERRGAERSALMRTDETDPVAKADDHARLHEELNRLPERYRRPLVLCHLEGLTHEEAADQLGCPAKTVHTRLTRGKARLRERLIRIGFASSAALLAIPSAKAAPPPSAWVESMARSAVEFAGGKSASTAATTLAKGVLSTMIATKLKIAIVGAVTCALMLGLIPMAMKPKAASAERRIAKVAPPDDPPAKKEEPKGKSRAAEITILDAETGKPIEGAIVDAAINFVHRQFSSDARGVARIDLSNKKGWRFNADVWAEGYVQQRTSDSEERAQINQSIQRYEFRLHKGNQTLGGTVKDEKGNPIPGVEVNLWGYLGKMKNPNELTFMVRVRTDEKGQWRCSSLRDMQFVHLYLKHPDFLADDQFHAREFGKPRDAVGTETLKPLRDFTDVQVMVPGVTLRGRITDEVGNPIAGAEVTWMESEHAKTVSNYDLAWVRTDADGRYVIPHARPGDLRIVARAKGRVADSIRVQDTTKSGDLAIRLKQGKTITGRVVDGKRQPLEGVLVNFGRRSYSPAMDGHTATDHEGAFRWDESPDDSVILSASRPDTIPEKGSTVSPGSEWLFTLRKSMTIDGTVRDRVTKKRIEWAVVEVGTVDAKTGEVAWRRSDGSGSSVMVRSGDLFGAFDAEESVVYKLRITTPGYAPSVTRSISSDEGAVHLEISLTPATARP